MDLLTACQTYFNDGAEATIDKITILSYPAGMPDEDDYEPYEVNVRIDFKDETVSDWKLTRNPDNGSVLDAYCYNDVI